MVLISAKMRHTVLLFLSGFLHTAVATTEELQNNNSDKLMKNEGDELYDTAMNILRAPEYEERQIIMSDSSQIYRSARIEKRYTKFLDVSMYKIEQDIFWNGVNKTETYLKSFSASLVEDDLNYSEEDLLELVGGFVEATDPQKLAYGHLVKAAMDHHHLDSLYELSQLHLWNDYGFIGDKLEGFNYLLEFDKVCLEHNYTRNASVLFQIGVGYSTGLFERNPDHLAALTYYQTAADMGDLGSIQALAYRYYTGFGGVPTDCSKAQLLYSTLAEFLRFQIDSAKTHNMSWDVLPMIEETYNIRVCDLKDGLIGESDLSSVFSRNTKSRLKAKLPNLPGYGIGANENSLNHFLSNIQNQQDQQEQQAAVPHNNARGRGGFNVVFGFPTDMSFNLMFGESNNEYKNDQLIYQYYDALNANEGTFFFQRNATYAVELLTDIYRTYDHQVDTEFNEHQKYFFSKALDLLGHILLTEEVTYDQDHELATAVLLRAKEVMERPFLIGKFPSRANIDLAIIAHYHEGNFTKAEQYYKMMINTPHDDGTAAYNFAKLKLAQMEFLAQGNEQQIGPDINAELLLQKAVYRGYAPALYMWSKIAENSEPNKYRCEDNVLTLKTFTEDMETYLAPYLKKSFTKYINNDDYGALWGYAMAAEQGFEPAQTSVAYMLVSPLLMFESLPVDVPVIIKKLAISYYVRSYKQNNVDAGLIAGDMYFREGDYQNAAALYQGTASKFSVQGLWNLGYMYEMGLGVEKDFHLAKRYYEQILEHKSLYIAVKLSVLKLQFKRFWNMFMRDFTLVDIQPLLVVFTKCLFFVNKLYLYIERRRYQALHKLYSIFGKHISRISKVDVSGLVSTLDSFGIDPELLVSLLATGSFILLPIVLTRLAVRNGWNVVINGVPVNPRPQAPVPVEPVHTEIPVQAATQEQLDRATPPEPAVSTLNERRSSETFSHPIVPEHSSEPNHGDSNNNDGDSIDDVDIVEYM